MEKQPFSHYWVRFNDCDPFGHLNNARYLDYCLDAREDHLREHYGVDLKEWATRGIGFVVNRHEIRYLRPANYNERVCVQSMVIGLADTWLTVEMSLWDDAHRQLKALLWTNFTRIDARTGKKQAHDPEFLERFGPLVMTVEADQDARIAALKPS
ncbi:MAG TPA: acyl-CoA thioesterase [Dinghuibacter sp.]|uniref:acyl-CoA thioesterase n=1 Tax=Dinghuibacter sp. TaxID=2024697 RepID=UPI002C118491|nr:acyl-CoA thioesterase [Dinghuibacter sp.]HTJ13257.1 acyl-CoA thioesterase [Dinghuibacter sp.]